jgi:hypothetical protein
MLENSQTAIRGTLRADFISGGFDSISAGSSYKLPTFTEEFGHGNNQKDVSEDA